MHDFDPSVQTFSRSLHDTSSRPKRTELGVGTVAHPSGGVGSSGVCHSWNLGLARCSGDCCCSNSIVMSDFLRHMDFWTTRRIWIHLPLLQWHPRSGWDTEGPCTTGAYKGVLDRRRSRTSGDKRRSSSLRWMDD